MRFPIRFVLIALLLLVAAGGSLTLIETNSPAGTTPTPIAVNYQEGLCDSNGTSLVIDYGTSSSLALAIRCAKDFEGTGWDIFKATGIQAEGTKQYPIGFVCRLEGYPETELQDCDDTPRYAEGSWGYFTWNGNRWSVSGVGAVSRKLSCGDIDGWRFIEPGEDLANTPPRAKPKSIICD